MTFVLSPQKVILLAVHLAASSDIDNLSCLTSQHPKVLHKDLVLRILLTYLPETTPSSEYTSLLQELASGELAPRQQLDVDTSDLGDISDDEAARRVRKLHLLQLAIPDAQAGGEDDSITIFLFRRAYRVDEEAGMLTQLPFLLTPFLAHTPDIRTWMLSSLLPLLRRNYEYYTTNGIPYTLAEFQRLPDAVAVMALLSQTGTGSDYTSVGRDLRGLVGPWLQNDARWLSATSADESFRYAITADATGDDVFCPGWEKVLEWLLGHASQSWNVAVAAVKQWDGPEDVDLGDVDSWLREEQLRYLERRYARAVLGCAYLIPDTSLEAFEGAYQMVNKTMDLLGEDDLVSLQTAAEALPSVPPLDPKLLSNSKNTTWMRDGLLHETNPLTSPSSQTTHLLHGLILSAFLLSRRGITCTVKRAGDLLFVQDEREQKSQAAQLIHELASSISNKDDESWVKARKEILWLRDWGATSDDLQQGAGVFGRLSKDYLEAEILKALLPNGNFSLARALYEDGDANLPPSILQATVVAAALNAYDNASNPNRTRGGLKKCDEIINAFPRTVNNSTPSRQRIEALLKATHALSDYRLVLKQGEPFSPVVLRVHSDPIAIIGKVLEQNAKSYTRIQDLQEVGSNMVRSGLTLRSSSKLNAGSFHTPLPAHEEAAELSKAETRITALCIEAALREDDFETAYSFVATRLGVAQPSLSISQNARTGDDWGWRAALEAGSYTRNPRTTRPTHLGTASGNPEIRHLEQRIDCLSAALRIAPPSQLQTIIKSFRRCEEQLDFALKAEADLDAADDGDVYMPGGFGTPSGRHRRVSPALAQPKKTQADDAPMSIFDLSRATARAASRNFSALSSLHASTGAKTAPKNTTPAQATRASTDEGDGWGDWGEPDNMSHDQQRTRKRDQLRDAAMGTLTSGVGWLIGAQPQPQDGNSHNSEGR